MLRYKSLCILLIFLFNAIGPLPQAQADEFRLPAPGVRVDLSPEFNPAILKGIKVYPDNPFRFDFILDQGDNAPPLEETNRLIKYFLASLTIPEKDLWVNLSPYEKDRIIPQSFGLTEMGRDLLAEDYMLKQITASLIYPEGETGRKFWKRIYEEAAKKFGTTSIPVNTFNKVWIIPEKAVVDENAKAGTAYVAESKLKVMLEQDYLALEKNQSQPADILTKAILREIIIPELTKEVNEGKNFARLRQVYNSIILAAWYKKKIKDSILSLVYADKNKVAGVNNNDPQEKQKIYQRYLQAFKKGAYNYIKEDIDPLTQENIPRKYFSGGETFIDAAQVINIKQLSSTDMAMIESNTGSKTQRVTVEISNVQYQGQLDAAKMPQIDFAMNGIEEGSDMYWEMRTMIKSLGPQLKSNMEDELTRNPNSKTLSDLINDDEIQAQWLMQIIGQRKDRSNLFNLLMLGIKSPFRWVRSAALEAAGTIDDPRFNQVFLAALKDPNTQAVMGALKYLEDKGTEEEIPELIRIRNHEPEERVFQIYDEHSDIVAYTSPVTESNYTTLNLKFIGEELRENPVRGRISEVILKIKEKSIQQRKARTLPVKDIKDESLRDFLTWLKSEGLEDIVVIGGSVRDELVGKKPSDFDISVAVPLTDEEYFQMIPTVAQANERVYNYAREKLAALAAAISKENPGNQYSVEDFYDASKKIMWRGMEVQYSGPIKIMAEGQPVYIKRALIDKNTLGFYSSAAGPALLKMALDSNGQLYGNVESIDDLEQGRFFITGDPRNLNLVGVLRCIRLKHELSLSLSAENEVMLREKVASYKINHEDYLRSPFLREVIERQLLKIAQTAKGKMAAYYDLQSYGMPEILQRDPLNINVEAYFTDHAMATALQHDAAMEASSIKIVPAEMYDQRSGRITHQNRLPHSYFDLPSDRLGGSTNLMDVLQEASRQVLGNVPILSIVGSMTYMTKEDGTPDWGKINDIDLRIHTKVKIDSNTHNELLVSVYKILERQLGRGIVIAPEIDDKSKRRRNLGIDQWGIKDGQTGKIHNIQLMDAVEDDLLGVDSYRSYSVQDFFGGDTDILNAILTKAGYYFLIKKSLENYREVLAKINLLKTNPKTPEVWKIKLLKRLYQLAGLIGESHVAEFLLDAYTQLTHHYDELVFQSAYSRALGLLDAAMLHDPSNGNWESKDLWRFKSSKIDLDYVLRGGPISRPGKIYVLRRDTSIFDPEYELRDSSYKQGFVRADETWEIGKLIDLLMEEGRGQFPLIYKPNRSAFSDGAFFLETDQTREYLIITALSLPTKTLNLSRIIESVLKASSHIQVKRDSSKQLVQFTINRKDPKLRNILYSLFHAMEAEINPYMERIYYNPGFLESAEDFIKPEGRAFESRHRIVVDAQTGEINAQASGFLSFSRWGTSSYFTAFGQEERAKDVFEPFYSAGVVFRNDRRRFETYVRRLVSQQSQHVWQRLKGLGISAQGNTLEVQIDLMWLKNEQGGFPVPVITEGVISSDLKMDNAMRTNPIGGIDLASDKALNIRSIGQGITFHLDPAQLKQLRNSSGFTPVIIHIEPLGNIRKFLGFES